MSGGSAAARGRSAVNVLSMFPSSFCPPSCHPSHPAQPRKTPPSPSPRPVLPPHSSPAKRADESLAARNRCGSSGVVGGCKGGGGGGVEGRGGAGRYGWE